MSVGRVPLGMSEIPADEPEETPFSGTDDETDWVDVRMTDPQEGEWDIDAVVADGRVEYVDLRIRPALLTGFVECLVEDLDDEGAARVLQRLADRQDVDLDG
jgi:hypothetical protein